MARKIAVMAWAMMRDETNWDENKALQIEAPEPGSEEAAKEEVEKDQSENKPKAKTKPKLKRAKPQPPGPVISGEPKHPSGRGSRSGKRRSSTRRSPMKT